MPILVKKSGVVYRKIEELYVVPPEPIEIFFWYGGTHSPNLSINNPYRPGNLWSKKTWYEPVNENY